MRALFGLMVFGMQVAGLIIFIVGVLNGDNPVWLLGLGISFIGTILYGVLKLMTAAQRQGITERAVRGLGPVPPPNVQKQLWLHATRATMDGSAPSTSAIENYESLCRMWVEQHRTR